MKTIFLALLVTGAVAHAQSSVKPEPPGAGASSSSKPPAMGSQMNPSLQQKSTGPSTDEKAIIIQRRKREIVISGPLVQVTRPPRLKNVANLFNPFAPVTKAENDRAFRQAVRGPYDPTAEPQGITLIKVSF